MGFTQQSGCSEIAVLTVHSNGSTWTQVPVDRDRGDRDAGVVADPGAENAIQI